MATPIPNNAAVFAAAEAAELTSGRLFDVSPDLRCGGVTTDSRRVRPGDMFVALRGDRHDAHRFVEDAAARGAAFSVIEAASASQSRVPRLVVDDSLAALGSLARAHRRRWGGTVVAITGSVGKTTTKEMTAAVLEEALARPVARTEGNLNNEIGLPHTLLALDSSSSHAVVEAGTSAPGEIARLAAIAEPNVGVLTRVALSHVEGLGTLEAVADEKAALLNAVEPGGTRVINGDDPLVESRIDPSWPRLLRFGHGDHSDVRVISQRFTEDLRTEVVLEARDGQHSVHLSLLGDAAAMSVAAAVTTMQALAIDVSGVSRGLRAASRLLPMSGRMCLRHDKKGRVVLDDTYNASPTSVRHALYTAVEISRVLGSRVVAVLGDMLELGVHEAEEHQKLLEFCSGLSLRGFVACGERMTRAISDTPSADPSVTAHRDRASALKRIEELCEVGDVIVIKGSRSMGMEWFVEALGPFEGGPFEQRRFDVGESR